MNNILKRAQELRKFIEKMTGAVSDEEGYYFPEVFEQWNGNGTSYTEGQRITYKKRLYKVLQNHVSQSDWTPDTAVSLYVMVDNPETEWPEWRQPTGAHDAYSAGAKVTHNNKHWISNIDNNVYEPGVYGWTEA